MGWLTFDYFLLVFLTSCGLLQGVFALRGIAGLQFFRRRACAFVFAVVCTVGSFLWFFAKPDFDIPPNILEGKQQTLAFMGGAVSSVIFSLVVASLINWRRKFVSSVASDSCGLDELKQTTYIRILPNVKKDLNAFFRSVSSGVRK